MTDIEHAQAIRDAHQEFMRAVRCGWDAGLTVEANITLLYCGPWCLEIDVWRSTVLAQSRGNEWEVAGDS